MMRKWWSEWSMHRLLQLLEMLNICISCFEYKVREFHTCMSFEVVKKIFINSRLLQGKKIIKSASQQQFNKTMDIKSRLEDVILGQGSARSELMMRKKGRRMWFILFDMVIFSLT